MSDPSMMASQCQVLGIIFKSSGIQEVEGNMISNCLALSLMGQKSAEDSFCLVRKSESQYKQKDRGLEMEHPFRLLCSQCR